METWTSFLIGGKPPSTSNAPCNRSSWFHENNVRNKKQFCNFASITFFVNSTETEILNMFKLSFVWLILPNL